MKRWDLTSLPPSTEKQHPREPHPDAPRVPRQDGQIPRVLFSTPECRAVIVELEGGQSMGDHTVRERAVVQVVSGRVSIEAESDTVTCDAGALVVFDPGERHRVDALVDARLLLILAPWPAAGHYDEGEPARPGHLPPNASVDPVSPGEP